MKDEYNLYDQDHYVEKPNKADQTWWTKDAVLAFLVIGLSALDAVTLYTVIDTVMYNSQAVSIILTCGAALCLNFLPLIIGRYIHYIRYHINGAKEWMAIAMCVVFLVLFTASFYLRWETRELSFSGMESTMVDTTGQADGIESTDSNSREAVALTILLGILPGITSAINLALGYFSDDPVKRKLSVMKRDLERLYIHRDIMLAARSELDQDWNGRLRELDKERLEVAETTVSDVAEQVRALARHERAKKLGDPDSVALLTEPPLTDEEAENNANSTETDEETVNNADLTEVNEEVLKCA